MTPIASLSNKRYDFASKAAFDQLIVWLGSHVNRFHMQEREKEGIKILDLKGHITAGKSEAALRDAVAELVQVGSKKVILNLEDVSKIDSSGLTALLVSQAKVRRAGGGMRLIHLKPAHQELLSETALDNAFDTFPDEQDAINSFFPERNIQHYDILEFVSHQHEPLASLK